MAPRASGGQLPLIGLAYKLLVRDTTVAQHKGVKSLSIFRLPQYCGEGEICRLLLTKHLGSIYSGLLLPKKTTFRFKSINCSLIDNLVP